MNAGLIWNLTWKMRLTQWFRPWISHESLAELDFSGITEVGFSGLGYTINVVPGTADPAGSLGAVENPELLVFPGHKNIAVSIDNSLCFRRIVEFPAQTEATLAKALRLDLLRVTPFNPDDIITAHRILNSANAGNTWKVEQLVFKRQALEPLRRVLTAQKRRLEAIVFRDHQGSLWPIALSGDGKLYGSDRHKRWLKLAAISFLAITIGGAASISASSWQAADQSQEVAAKIAGLKPEADKVLARVEGLKLSSAALQEMGDWKNNSLHLPNFIEELSRLLPDDAFLEGLTLDGTTVVLEGQAAKPEDLISKLEASSLFAKVAFSAPVYRNPAETQSHFSIRMEGVHFGGDDETAGLVPR